MIKKKMERRNGFGYDGDGKDYTVSYTEKKDDGTIVTTQKKIDEDLNGKIKKLAEKAEKNERFTIAQLQFLEKHKDDAKIAPELERFNRDYLTELRQKIKEYRREEVLEQQAVTEKWSTLKNESLDPMTAFLTSFMTTYSRNREKLMMQAELAEEEMLRKDLKEKRNGIAEYLNALEFKEGDAKIFHVENGEGERVFIARDKAEWLALANDGEFRRVVSDEYSQTSLYSTTVEVLEKMERELEEVSDKRRYLDERLGGPAAQKCYGEGVEGGVGKSQEETVEREERKDIRVKDLWEINKGLGEMIRKVDHEPGEGETEYFTSVSIEGRLSREEEEAYRVLAQKMGCENMTSDGWVHEFQFPYMHAGADVFIGEAEADLVRRMGVSPETVLVEKERNMEEKEAESQEKERKEEAKEETPEEERKRKEEEQKRVERIEKMEGAVLLHGMERVKALEETARIERALKEEHGIDTGTKEGGDILRRLLEGEKAEIRSEDGNISYDIALAKGKDGLGILSGNLTVRDTAKLSEEERATAGKLEGRNIHHYMDAGERIAWAVVTEDNIPDQIKGHSVTHEEKRAMLRGESIVIEGCTEGSKDPYSAEVHMNLEKRGGKIKPVMSVKPKREERQKQQRQQKPKAGQSQRQGVRQ
jgi:hypothetical protein